MTRPVDASRSGNGSGAGGYRRSLRGILGLGLATVSNGFLLRDLKTKVLNSTGDAPKMCTRDLYSAFVIGIH